MVDSLTLPDGNPFIGLNAIEMRIAVALCYAPSPEEACSAIGIPEATWLSIMPERRQLIEEAAASSAMNMVSGAANLLQQASMMAAQEMVELLSSEDESVRLNAAKHILAVNNIQKPSPVQKSNTNIQIKQYAILGASPDIWDEDVEVVDGMIVESDNNGNNEDNLLESGDE